MCAGEGITDSNPHDVVFYVKMRIFCKISTYSMDHNSIVSLLYCYSYYIDSCVSLGLSGTSVFI